MNQRSEPFVSRYEAYPETTFVEPLLHEMVRHSVSKASGDDSKGSGSFVNILRSYGARTGRAILDVGFLGIESNISKVLFLLYLLMHGSEFVRIVLLYS